MSPSLLDPGAAYAPAYETDRHLCAHMPQVSQARAVHHFFLFHYFCTFYSISSQFFHSLPHPPQKQDYCFNIDKKGLPRHVMSRQPFSSPLFSLSASHQRSKYSLHKSAVSTGFSICGIPFVPSIRTASIAGLKCVYPAIVSSIPSMASPPIIYML